MKKFLKVQQHWMKEDRDEIENVYLLEDGSFHYTRLQGDWRTIIQSRQISQDSAEKIVGHIIPNRDAHFYYGDPLKTGFLCSKK